MSSGNDHRALIKLIQQKGSVYATSLFQNPNLLASGPIINGQLQPFQNSGSAISIKNSKLSIHPDGNVHFKVNGFSKITNYKIPSLNTLTSPIIIAEIHPAKLDLYPKIGSPRATDMVISLPFAPKTPFVINLAVCPHVPSDGNKGKISVPVPNYPKGTAALAYYKQLKDFAVAFVLGQTSQLKSLSTETRVFEDWYFFIKKNPNDYLPTKTLVGDGEFELEGRKIHIGKPTIINRRGDNKQLPKQDIKGP